MRVRDMRVESLLSIRTIDRLTDAAEQMAFYEVGALAVIDSGQLAGILSERDIVRAVGDRADPASATVGQYMTEYPTTVDAEMDVDQAATLMLQIGVRHLPVVDGATPIGMISMRDLLAVGNAAS